jgi:hypothetical protein
MEKKIEEIVDRLKTIVRDMLTNEEDMKSKSFDYEEGIVISGNDAQLIISALSKEENKISKLTFDKEISQWVDIYSYELGLIKGKEEGYQAANAAVQGYREALEKIAMLCDNQNNTHDDIWHIAYAALFKAEDKGEVLVGEIQFPFNDKKSWVEDFSHENGQYQNRCFLCTHYFIGHKRRVICKECFNKTKLSPQPTNSLDELERWLKTYSANSAFYISDLLAKIQELKTITT